MGGSLSGLSSEGEEKVHEIRLDGAVRVQITGGTLVL